MCNYQLVARKRSHNHLFHGLCSLLIFHRADPLNQAIKDHLESTQNVLKNLDLRLDRIERTLSRIRQSNSADKSVHELKVVHVYDPWLVAMVRNGSYESLPFVDSTSSDS